MTTQVQPLAGAEPAKIQALAAPALRLVSLDAFRGFVMFWIVGGSALMLGLQRLGGNPVVDTIVGQLRHTDWQGLRFYDLIWPAFMLMTGMSVPFSYARLSQVQAHRDVFLRVLRRCLGVCLLGWPWDARLGSAAYWVAWSNRGE